MGFNPPALRSGQTSDTAYNAAMAQPLKRSASNLCSGDLIMALDKRRCDCEMTVTELRAGLVAKFSNELMIRELQTWQLRIVRLATPFQRYANSTTNRSMTARLLTIARNRAVTEEKYLGVTKKECAAGLGISLNAASQIVSHYVKEGWAVAHESSCKHFQAGRVLIDSTDEYARRVFDLTPTSLWSNHQKLMDFDQITTSHLDFTDDSKSE